MRQFLGRLAEEYLWWIIRSWPGFEGVWFRYLFLKLFTRRLDGFCWIAQGCQLVNCHNLSIGRNFATSRNVLIDALGGIEIGDDTGVGPNSVIISHEHRMVSQGGHFGPNARRLKPIRLGSRVWIGANTFIKAGIDIGDDAVVGACSNVIESVPQGGRVIGSPARPYFEVLREAARARKARATAEPGPGGNG